MYTPVAIYFRYSALKKHIYQLEKKQSEQTDSLIPDLESDEHTALIAGSSVADVVFVPLLDRELKKICVFYEVQEKEILDEIRELEESITAKEEESAAAADQYLIADDDDDDDDDDDIDIEASAGGRGHERGGSTRSANQPGRRGSFSGRRRGTRMKFEICITVVN